MAEQYNSLSLEVTQLGRSVGAHLYEVRCCLVDAYQCRRSRGFTHALCPPGAYAVLSRSTSSLQGTLYLCWMYTDAVLYTMQSSMRYRRIAQVRDSQFLSTSTACGNRAVCLPDTLRLGVRKFECGDKCNRAEHLFMLCKAWVVKITGVVDKSASVKPF